MRLLKPHSHTSERPGREARKNAKRSNGRKRRHFDKANQPSKTCRVPPVWRRGAAKRKALWQDKPPSKSYRVPSAWRGGETKKVELKDNIGEKIRKTNTKTLPRATIVAGGGETKGENHHER